MRSYRRFVLACAVLGLCGLVFGALQTHRARRIEARITGGRRTQALSRSRGDRATLRRELAKREAERGVFAARALAARSGARAHERAVDASLASTGVEEVARTPWTEVEEIAGKLGPHVAAFSTKRTGRLAFPALVRLARSWEGWPDRARLRSLEVRPAGPGRVEATWELVVARVLPSARPLPSAAEHTPPDGGRASRVARLLRPPEAVQNPFARAFARARLRELWGTVQGVVAGSDPRALVSGRVVRVGDRLDVFTIESIDREGVVIRGPGGLRARLRRRASALPRTAKD